VRVLRDGACAPPLGMNGLGVVGLFFKSSLYLIRDLCLTTFIPLPRTC